MAAERANEGKKSRGALGAIATLLALATPGAYLIGLSYYQGYMNAFGIDTDGFPLAAPDIYVFSYQTVGYLLLALGNAAGEFLNSLFSPPKLYWVLGSLGMSVGTVYWVIKMVRRGPRPRLSLAFNSAKRLISWLHWKNNDFTKSIGIVGLISYSALAAISSIAVVAVSWWLLPLGAYYKGQSIAEERIHAYREKGCQPDAKTKWDSCFLVLDNKGEVIHEGLLIAMNDKELAIFKQNGGYVFKRLDGQTLRRTLH